MTRKEVVKFFSGFAAAQALTHGERAAGGAQFTLLGISYTPGLNTIAAVVWALVSIVLVHYAWIRT